ncbi:Uncharacterised protein [Escherichia coli]|uniref:hypothetical protein n=1 Tax=Escherichia coli TaxID=562 RepID=UPI000DFCC295|nr:hypothetical protein [Escherichia coli]STG94615.1 Uncharacterised protein [Escherichia coli]
MFLSEYSGKVIPTGEFKTDDFLISLKDAFKQHWRHGHHPDLGKDTLFERPDEVLGFHLRKVHVNMVNMHHIHTHVLNSVGMSGHMD